MTEAEWLACEDPAPMIEFLRGKVSERKLRLFCCACCRRVWHHLGRGRRRAVEIAERCADGVAGWWGSLWGEFLSLPLGNWQQESGGPQRAAVHVAVSAWPGGRRPDPVAAATQVAQLTAADDPTAAVSQAALLREVVGPLPFRVRWAWQRRGVAVQPDWLTSTVGTLASQMYESRNFGAMPILADALQDAGCDNDEVLNHCRDERATHVRGCWVVDLVLGKS
jgi:hypothetical protein